MSEVVPGRTEVIEHAIRLDRLRLTIRRRFMDSKVETVGLDEQEVAKKTYHKPEVLMYGSIREITKNAGSKGALDGGGGAAAGPKTGV